MAKYCGPEIICIVTGRPGADLHHLYTRRAHPKFKDEVWNLMPITHSVHQLIHSRGLNWAVCEMKPIFDWLVAMGWSYDEYARRWMHPKALGEDQ